MFKTVRAIVKNGQVELLENIQLSEGTKVLVTLIDEENREQFWVDASQKALDKVWDNEEDNIYEELLQK